MAAVTILEAQTQQRQTGNGSHTPVLDVSGEDEAPVPAALLHVRQDADRLFERLARQFPDLRMEQTPDGEITIMPPAFTETGRRNFRLTGQLGLWLEGGGGGEGFDSSTGFVLPNGAKRSPDLSWITSARWSALSACEKGKFVAICPDFVVELRSETDRLSTLQKKMREYMDNGARLGWLINPRSRTVEVYCPGRDVEVLDNPTSLSGEDVLPGFTLDLTKLWD